VWTVALSEWGMNPHIVPWTNPGGEKNATQNIKTQHGVLHSKTASCVSTWAENVLGLKVLAEGGYCHKTLPAAFQSQVPNSFPASIRPDHAKAFNMTPGCNTTGCCPVFTGLNDTHFADCIMYWGTQTTGATLTSPGFLSGPGHTGYANGVQMPIKMTTAGSNLMYAYNLFSTSDYTDLLKDTRKFVDDNPEMHSWMDGIAFDYWEQYLTLESFVYSIGGIAICAGFILSFVFLFGELTFNKFGTLPQRLVAVFVMAFLVAMVMLASMVTVLGLTSWFDVQLSAFTALSCLLASGFAIEYAVHVVHHFLEAQQDSAVERSVHAMAFLFVPTAMSFFSSAISVVPLGFSGFRFVTRFFFYPLLFVVVVTYWYGAVALPLILSFLNCLPRLVKEQATFPQEATQQKDQDPAKIGKQGEAIDKIEEKIEEQTETIKDAGKPTILQTVEDHGAIDLEKVEKNDDGKAAILPGDESNTTRVRSNTIISL